MYIAAFFSRASLVCFATGRRDPFWGCCCSSSTSSTSSKGRAWNVDVNVIIEGRGMSPHLYADDAQISGSCYPSNVETFSSSISDCLRVVSSWTRSNRLELNSSKTGVWWCATSWRQQSLPASALSVNGVMVDPVTLVCNLGIFIDAELSMRTQVQQTFPQCFAALCQLSPTRTASNVPETGGHPILPAHLVCWLQSVQKASVTPTLVQPHYTHARQYTLVEHSSIRSLKC